MADLHDDDYLFEDMSPESPGTIGRNIVRRLGLARLVAEAITSNNNSSVNNKASTSTDVASPLTLATSSIKENLLRPILRAKSNAVGKDRFLWDCLTQESYPQGVLIKTLSE